MPPYDDGPIDPFYPHGRPSGAASPNVSRAIYAPKAAPAMRPEAARLPPSAATRRPAPAAMPAPAGPRPVARPNAARLVRAFLPLLLAAGAGAAYYAYNAMFESQKLLVLNGLDLTVDVLLMDDDNHELREEIPPRGRASFDISGYVYLDAVTRDGRPVETADFEVPPDTDLVAYNLLGAAAVQLEEVVYSAQAPINEPTLIPYEGERLIVRDDVTYIFVEPPNEVTLRDSSSVVAHWYFGYVGDGSWLTTLNLLLEATPGGLSNPSNRARAQAIVDAVLRLDPHNEEARRYQAMLLGSASERSRYLTPPATAPPARPLGPGEVRGPGGIGRVPPPGGNK